jgi:hypothetical protein
MKKTPLALDILDEIFKFDAEHDDRLASRGGCPLVHRR